ncbi:MAG: hypothetical protein HQL08_05630 [Nitrospirae bacterium]|nr:hypothetical protein [Nitrospirota bacterium]
MKTIQGKLYKGVIFMALAVGVPAFIAGWLVAVNFSGVFETGYKMAFLDIRSAVKESAKDGQEHFYMNGIRFCPIKNTESTAFADIRISGEDEKIEKTKQDDWTAGLMQQRKILIARIPR